MQQSTKSITIPRYYRPRPYQVGAWQRRNSGLLHYYFKIDCRQSGKDTDDIEYCLNFSWKNPGTQTAYVGLDNVWIYQNIFNKYIDNRRFWDDYPESDIEPKDTKREVIFRNNPPGLAPARIKFIGFLNDDQLIGSSYDRFFISEGSLYKNHAFSFVEPIWDQKIAAGLPLLVNVNGTPRGVRNNLYTMLQTYTGVDDPEDFPGQHGDCYVEKFTIHDLVVADGNGGWRKLYDDAAIERLKDRYLRQYGNLNLYRQEFECDFLTVNAGLVYQAIEVLEKEGRYCSYNIDTSRPVYVAFDISSKDKTTDATSAIVYQYYNGRMFIYDVFEARGKALVDCIAELSKRGYWQYVRLGVLPWDSERSASSETPIEEATRMYPNVNWHALDKERVDRGIQEVRRMIPNMVINSDLCDPLMDAFNNYEYKRLEAEDDWSAKPRHNWASHLMDALRYAVMGIKEIQYFQLNDVGTYEMPASYTGFDEDEDEFQGNTFRRKPERRSEGGVYY